VDILQELHMLKIATYAGLSKRCFVTWKVLISCTTYH
jgi:hypothetical protein